MQLRCHVILSPVVYGFVRAHARVCEFPYYRSDVRRPQTNMNRYLMWIEATSILLVGHGAKILWRRCVIRGSKFRNVLIHGHSAYQGEFLKNCGSFLVV